MQFEHCKSTIERALNGQKAFANLRTGKIGPEVCLHASCVSIARVMGLDDLILYLMNNEENCLHQVAGISQKATCDKKVLNPLTIPVGQGIVGSVAASKRPEIVNDTSEDVRYLLDDEYRLSEVAVPILDGGKVVALLDSEDKRPWRFGESQVGLLTHAGQILLPRLVEIRESFPRRDQSLSEFTF